MAQAYLATYQEAVRGRALAKSAEQMADEIIGSYPFHPSYKDILSLFKENEKFRQTRGLIQFTANLMRGVWGRKDREEVFLIGAQFLDFSDQETRDQVKEIERSLESALASDVYDTDGSAHAQGIDGDRNDRAASQVARAGAEIGKVFPRLITVSTETSGEGVTLKVHFSKKEGAPVRYVSGDDLEEAAAVREVDIRKKFHMRAGDLAKAVKLTEPKSKALRWHLRIDEDSDCLHVFEFGKSSFACFSDNAKNKMKQALADGLDMTTVWKAYKARE